DFDKDSIVQIAMNDLRTVLPAVNAASLTHSLVIKEKRATFSPRPGMELVRPGTKTKIRNLFLAGDWTNTGYPATIEGAVMSGRKAAKEAISIQQSVPAG
ncbi:MAG TPA: FAD-dependent oxidoreductase, partial [Bacteroidota bacterium]|nr:FAD-dependent oxidoreductase [Bacteroidota bacterium]